MSVMTNDTNFDLNPVSTEPQHDVIFIEPTKQLGPLSIPLLVDPNTIFVTFEDDYRNDNVANAATTEERVQLGSCLTDEGESISNKVEVEQALKAAHFHQVNGFELEYKCGTCCPSLTIVPTYFSMPTEEWKMDVGATAGCFCCCLPRAFGWRTVSIKQGGMEVINFTYRPKIWCCWSRSKRLVNIYIPQRTERVGWMECGDNFEDASTIVDSVNFKLFHVGEIKEHPTMGLVISNHDGTPLAICKAMEGFNTRGVTSWKEFSMEYLPSAANLELSSKAVTLAAFHVWALRHREKAGRELMWPALIGVVLGIVLTGVIIIYITYFGSNK